MALKLDGLRKLVEGAGLRYFLAPDRPMVMMGVEGVNGRFQLVVALEEGGQFLQFRTVEYLWCPGDHPHLAEVLKVLGAINYRRRLVKFGWDPGEGEIVGYADIWLMDGTVTQQQFARMLHSFFPVIDLGFGRIKKAMETGKDPGEADPGDVLRTMLGRALPEPVRALLEKLVGKKEPEGEGGQPPDFSTI